MIFLNKIKYYIKMKKKNPYWIILIKIRTEKTIKPIRSKYLIIYMSSIIPYEIILYDFFFDRKIIFIMGIKF